MGLLFNILLAPVLGPLLPFLIIARLFLTLAFLPITLLFLPVLIPFWIAKTVFKTVMFFVLLPFAPILLPLKIIRMFMPF